MNPNPLFDTAKFLVQPGWTTAIFWVLLLGSVAIALYVHHTIPSQRSVAHLGNWGIRLLIGCMWWQQTLWKLPPFYTDQPQEPFGTTGLAYWMGLMASTFAWHLLDQVEDDFGLTADREAVKVA